MTAEELLDKAYRGEKLAEPGNRNNTIHRLAVIRAHQTCSSVNTVWEEVREAVEKTDPENGKETFFASFNRARREDAAANIERRVLDNGGLVFRISGKAAAGKTSTARTMRVTFGKERFPLVVIDDADVRLYRDVFASGEEVTLDNRDDYYAAKTLIVVEENS